MTEEFRQMELAHCRQLLALIDAALERVPQADLLAAFERIRRDDAERLAEMAVLAWRQNGQNRHRQLLLDERTADLERADANNRRLIAQSFVKQMANRKDVRPLEGQDASCEALNGDTYCGERAVAEVATRGGWRPVCGAHLEGL